MSNSFRYVERSESACVELHLFQAEDGKPRGHVTGPILDQDSVAFFDVVELVRCASLDDAFQVGIRMANRNDAELVISGNREFWLSNWGTLDRAQVGTALVPAND